MSLKSIAEQAAHSLGAANLIRRRNQASARILMYHRFHGPPDELRARLSAQCEHLSRHYHPMSLDQLAAAARQNRPLPPNALAITVDDGYADFAQAFPIFQNFGLKVTLYVVSGFADGKLWLWTDQLLYLLQNTKLGSVKIQISAGAIQQTLADPVAAFEVLCQKMITLPNAERLKVLQSLPSILRTDLPDSPPEKFAALSFSQLRDLASQGLDIGAHTANHPILSKLETEAELKHEIAGSRARIQEATGTPVNHFCYPNGKHPDVNSDATRAAEAAGYQSAVLAETGLAGPPFSLYALKRIGVDPYYPPLYFERCVAGYRA